MSKTIVLTQGKLAIVSDEDFEWASQFRWYAHNHPSKSRDNWYARRNPPAVNGRVRGSIYLHREIARRAGLPSSPRYDHRNGDGLDNQRGNIRPCTQSQNLANMRKFLGTGSSRFKGVSWSRQHGKWGAKVQVNQKQIWLGLFATEEAGHRAYATAAKNYFGEFSRA